MPVRMFLANFGPKKYNWMLPTPLGEARPEEELKSWPLIDRPAMSKKLDGKATLITTVWMVKQPPPQTQAPSRLAAQPAQMRESSEPSSSD